MSASIAPSIAASNTPADVAGHVPPRQPDVRAAAASNQIAKLSVNLRQRSTSISGPADTLKRFRAIAIDRGMRLCDLILQIDESRGNKKLSRAVRDFVASDLPVTVSASTSPDDFEASINVYDVDD